MTDDNYGLSRRKLLGGIATVGAASALGGAGSFAFFSDDETFANNQLIAGELDLKVDWEEHYSDWSADETSGLQNPVLMETPESNDYLGIPSVSPMVWVHGDDIDTFMGNTAIEAYPDEDNDGSQNAPSDWNICDVQADTPDALSSNLRTNGTIGGPPNAQTTNPGDPLVNISDVKPGDFGEVTFSFHLCDNPGFVWLNGELVEAAENGHTEPEAADEHEDGPANEVITELGQGDNIELLDTVQTALWYDDNCDNLMQGRGGAGGQVDVVIVLDESGSMSNQDVSDTRDAARAFVDLLGGSDASAAAAFANSTTIKQNLTTDKNAVKSAIGTGSTGRTSGGTDMTEAINTAQNELDTNGRSGADKFIVLLTDGFPNNTTTTLQAADAAKSAGTEMITLGFGTSVSDTILKAIAGVTPNSESSYPGSVDAEGNYFAAPTADELDDAFGDIGSVVGAGEELIFTGTLREMLTQLENEVPLEGDLEAEEAGGKGRNCFAGGTTHCLGFAWWLPVDHANEIQGDSASFNIGFYTEQCRHNDQSMGNVGNA